MTNGELSRFERLCHQRHNMGMEERGRKPDEPFVGDPKQELLEELADGINYLVEIQKSGGIPLRVIRTIYDHLTRAAVLLISCEYDQPLCLGPSL